MVRPKKEGAKAVKRSVSLDPELFKWVNEKIKIKRFSTLSHAINEALHELKKQLDKEK